MPGWPDHVSAVRDREQSGLGSRGRIAGYAGLRRATARRRALRDQVLQQLQRRRVAPATSRLRTNINEWSPETLWVAYVQLTDAEGAFRIHKRSCRNDFVRRLR